MIAQHISIGDLLDVDWEYESGGTLMLVVGVCKGTRGFVVVDCKTGERLELYNMVTNEYIRRVG